MPFLKKLPALRLVPSFAPPEQKSAVVTPPAPLPKPELRISEDFSLPLDTAAQSLAIVAQRGSGKTYTAKVLAEELLRNRVRVCILDLLGVFHGLQASEDGEREGFPIRILGGDHGDELDPSKGAELARWVASDGFEACILDLSHLRREQQRELVATFAGELFEASTNASKPTHLIVDEADVFIPQKPSKADRASLEAFEDVVRRGRVKGLGITVITQRPAVLNKDILTQVSALVVLRMMGPQDRRAIEDWVRMHADLRKGASMLSSLGALPVGTAWVWSPGWLGVLRKAKIRKAHTWDSSATPKVGEPRREPRVRAKAPHAPYLV
jgi:DNA helicase HerA-like ATPase